MQTFKLKKKNEELETHTYLQIEAHCMLWLHQLIVPSYHIVHLSSLLTCSHSALFTAESWEDIMGSLSAIG